MAVTDMAANKVLGKFISIEGQDGAGKTTNLDVIVDFLNSQKIEYILTREPGGTELGEAIRGVILGSDTPIEPVAEILLMFAARSQHIQQIIMPALKRGEWVICDRFTDATYAYQGGGHGIDIGLITQIEQTAINALKPDLTLLLDLDVSIGLQRTSARGEQQDRFERQENTFKQRVRDQYIQRQQSEPNRIKRIDASQSIESVKSSIEVVLREFLNGVDS